MALQHTKSEQMANVLQMCCWPPFPETLGNSGEFLWGLVIGSRCTVKKKWSWWVDRKTDVQISLPATVTPYIIAHISVFTVERKMRFGYYHCCGEKAAEIQSSLDSKCNPDTSSLVLGGQFPPAPKSSSHSGRWFEKHPPSMVPHLKSADTKDHLRKHKVFVCPSLRGCHPSFPSETC